MQGGASSKLSFQWYIDLLQHIRQKYPHINIHGQSPEFQHFTETFRYAAARSDSQLRTRARIDPRVRGEILVDRVRKGIFALKINSDEC